MSKTDQFWSSYETLENTCQIKLKMKFYFCLDNFSELWIYFLEFPWVIVFGVISGNYLRL